MSSFMRPVTMNSKVKLLLVDDHALFREGLTSLMRSFCSDCEISQSGYLDEAIELCREQPFDLVLLDLGLARSNGVETLQAFRAAVPDLPVVVLSGESAPRVVRESLEAGAVGFVPKSHTADLMIAALQFVLSGGVYLPPCAMEIDSARPPTPHADHLRPASMPNMFERLTPRQQEVAQLLLQGLPNKTIARRLGLSDGTIKAHVSAIFQVIGVRSRVEAVMAAAQLGIKVM